MNGAVWVRSIRRNGPVRLVQEGDTRKIIAPIDVGPIVLKASKRVRRKYCNLTGCTLSINGFIILRIILRKIKNVN